MKTLAKTSVNNTRFLVYTVLLSLVIALLAGPAMAQGPGKNKRGDKMPQGTLKEAIVTAPVTTTVEEISPMRVRLNVLNPTGKTVRISILNFANLPVYQESFTGKEFNKILNFTKTEAGRYSLHVTGHKQSEVKRFAIDSKQKRNLTPTEMINQNPAYVMAAIYNPKPDQIMLHVVNNTGKPIDYVLRNAEKEVVYRGLIRNAAYTKLFNMDDTADGQYTFEVNDKNAKAASRTFDMKTSYERSFAWTDKRGRPLKPAAPEVSTKK